MQRLIQRCLFVIAIATFSLITPSGAQVPLPKPSQALQPCVEHERVMGCKTKDGQPGLQEQLCTNGKWTNSGVCVRIVKRLTIDRRRCTVGSLHYITCETDIDKLQKQTCVGGKWVNTGGCIASPAEPPPSRPK